MGFSDFFKKALGVISPTAALGTGAALAGDYMAMQEGEDANRRNIAAQERMNAQNIQAQERFAQMGVRWRVQDAIAAGLHPLAALGSSGSTFSPSFQAFNESAPKADMYSSMGQNISRAMAATSTGEERMMRKLQIDNQRLQNYMLAKQAGLVPWVGQVGPSFPSDGNSSINIPGQGESSVPVQIMPLGRTASPAGHPDQAYGNVTMRTYVKHPDGSLEPISSPDVQGDKANDVLAMIKHHINMFAHKYGNPASMAPGSDQKLPPGAIGWEFRNWTGRYHPYYSKRSRR